MILKTRLTLILIGVTLLTGVMLLGLPESPARADQTLTVTSTDDTVAADGHCTLREAIQAANSNSTVNECSHDGSTGTDTIAFAIGTLGSQQTITLTGNLPSISEPVSLDGWTQGGAGYTGPPLIELDGSNLTASSNHGFRITGGGSTVRGFIIHSFDDASSSAVWLHTADGNWIAGNYIGVNADGVAVLPNTYGIWINERGNNEPSHNNLIGTDGDGVNDAAEGNLIAGSIQEDVRVETSGNWIAGNHIGVTADGSAALASNNTGIRLYGDNNIIGTNGDGASDDLEGNVISGHNYGIGISNSSGHTIAGNIIGLDAAGSAILGNSSNGIDCNASSTDSRNIIIGSNNDGLSDDLEGNVISGNGSRGYNTSHNNCRHITISRNKIGADSTGTVALGNGAQGIIISAGDWYTITHNIISGNGTNGTAAGITLGSGANRITISDNIIGSDLNGAADLGNTGDGLEISFSHNQTIQRNQISGNGGEGILISSGDGTLIEDNLIGVQADGRSELGNGGHGVYIVGDANSSTIVSNTIAFHGRHGVLIDGSSQTISNTISANSVFSNTDLGIDLDFDGVTTNDADDSDTGPNNLQNYPVIEAVDSRGGIVTVTGSLTSTANTTFTLEFFANSVCDDSGFGEGESYLGADVVTTNGSGRVDFVSILSAPGVDGQYLTATATDPGGNSSEFSECFTEPIGFDPISGLQAENDSPTILGFTTHFTASVATGSNISYEWAFGDGHTATGPTGSHLYASPGNYTAIVTATNTWGSQWIASPVTISAPLACAATPNDGSTVYYSNDATAVQQAVDDPASTGGLVKVAGICAGVSARDGTNQSLYLTKTLTLRGGYSYLDWSVSDPAARPTTLDAQDSGRVLLITGTVPVTLENLMVQNGLLTASSYDCPAECGGGILSNGPLTLAGLTIQNNRAARGGAAYLLGPATIENSAWFSNNATFQGGALYSRDAAVIRESRFEGNRGSYGGAIASLNSGLLTVENSTFRQNLAESAAAGGGGAIHAAVPVTVADSLFETNTSYYNGGGMTATDDVTIAQTEFISNTALSGGGLLSLGLTRIENSRFEGNLAQDEYGGGLALTSGPGASITATQFIANRAETAGGGIYQLQIPPFTGTVYLAGVTLQGNQARFGSGGGAYFGERLVMTGSTVEGNSTKDGRGGGLALGSSGDIQDSTFYGNQAQQGGAAFAEGPVAVENTDWSTNTATAEGGALYSRHTTFISGSSFTNNSGAYGGGLAALGGGYDPADPANFDYWLTVENSTFRQNLATSAAIGGGGAIHAAVPATVNNSLVESNSSTYNGGGMTATDPITVSQSDFIANTAVEGAGLLSLGVARIDHSRFERNDASVDGGGLALRQGAAITATQFLTNTAGNAGGGIYQVDSSPFADNVVLNGVTLQGNEAFVDGGGAFIGETLVMTGSLVTNNASLAVNGAGGGLAVGGSFDIRRSTLEGNQANGNGGGLALITNADSANPASRMVNSLLIGNEAELNRNDPSGQNGAGLFLDKGPVEVLHTTLANPTQVTGQAIYANAGIETIAIQNTIMASYTTGLAHEFSTQVNSVNNLYFGAVLTETWGVNSTNAMVGDPRFADPAGGDYHLLLGSAAIEAGAAANVLEDWEDDPRPVGNVVDIGVDEFGDGALLEEDSPSQLRSILSTNRQVFVTLPAGAVDSPATATLLPVVSPTQPVSGTRRFANVAFVLQALTLAQVTTSEYDFTFLTPVTVVVEYSDEDVAEIDEETLRLDVWNDEDGQWGDATTTCSPPGNLIREPESNRISVETCVTGEYALTGGATQAEETRVYLPVIIRNE